MKKSLLVVFLILLFLTALQAITLDEYMDLALKNSNEFQAAKIDLNIKKLDYQLAKSEFYPNIKLSLRMPNYSWNENYVNYFGIPQRISLITERNNLGGTFSIEQSLPFSGKLTISHSLNKYETNYNIYEDIKEFDNYSAFNFSLPILSYDPQRVNYLQKKAAYEIARNNFIRVKRKIKKTAMSYYIQALLYKKKEKIARDDLKISQMIYELTREKYDNGLSSEIDLMDSKIQITQKKINLLNIQHQKEEIIEKLKNYAKISVINIEEKEIKLFNNKLPSLNDILSKILKTDPDILNSEIAYNTLKYQTKYDKFRQYFSATLNLGYSLDGRGKSLADSFGNYKKNGWYGYITIDIPIFDYSKEKNSYLRNKFNLQSINLNIEDMKENLMEKIKNLYRNNENYKKTLELLELQVKQNKQLFEMSKLRYNNGLDDLKTLEQNQLNYLNAQYNLENNIYLLNQNYLDIIYYME